MAINIVTLGNSRYGYIHDFGTENFFLVQEGAFLIDDTKSDTTYTAFGHADIMIQGSVISRFSVAIDIASSSGLGNITITSSGLVSGINAISVSGDSNYINNSGKVSATLALGIGIVSSGNYNSITNSGDITGYSSILSQGSSLFINNTGEIVGYLDSLYAYKDANISNFGVMRGRLFVGADAFIRNTGTIDGSVFASGLIDGASTMENHGIITGGFFTSDGVDFVASDSVSNYDTMGAISLGYGDDAVVNYSGGVIAGSVELGRSDSSANADNDTLTNSGEIAGNVSAYSGDDVIDTSLGRITGIVNLGSGNDIYIGGDGVDRVIGGIGNDAIDLGAGNDVYRAGNADGKDVVDGGDGVDRYDASDATQAVTVDLAAGASAGTVNADLILNFENVTGGAAADTLTGSDDANRIDGGMGVDTIDGGAGADRLIGGTGTDTITGGAGRDVMTGGPASGSLDSDTFVFTNGSSGATATTRDVITDFTDHGHAAAPFATGADLIDLSAIDASSTAAGNQAFSFNATKGAAFSGAAGSLIWQQYGTHVLVSGDTNGDSKADFTIQLNGTHTLFASDFVL